MFGRGLGQAIVESLVVIEDGDGEDFLGVVLADDVGVQFAAELSWRDEFDRSEGLFLRSFLEGGATGSGGRRGLAVAGFLALE